MSGEWRHSPRRSISFARWSGLPLTQKQIVHSCEWRDTHRALILFLWGEDTVHQAKKFRSLAKLDLEETKNLQKGYGFFPYEKEKNLDAKRLFTFPLSLFRLFRPHQASIFPSCGGTFQRKYISRGTLKKKEAGANFLFLLFQDFMLLWILSSSTHTK